ncbi:DUF998 domain-containing protein [Microbacterium sp. GXF7504]
MDIAAYIAIAGVLVCAVALVALHVVPSGKSPVGDALSAYGATRYRPLYVAQAVAFGIGEIALGIAFLPIDGAVLATVLLLLLGLTRLGLAFLRVDDPDAAGTGPGVLHIALTVLGFAAATISAFVIGTVYAATGEGGLGFSDASNWLGWIIGAGSILALVLAATPALRRGFGLPERLVTLAILVWSLVVGIGTITVL